MRRLLVLRARVRLLASIDPAHELPGAGHHEYELAPPLTEEELAALEAQVGPLPPMYRALIRTVAAHGAGPHCGLCEPHAPDGASPWQLFDAASLDGALVIAMHADGGRTLLVVRGPHAGELWSERGGAAKREAPDVAAWYEAWLDGALRAWCIDAAPRIALDGPIDAAELEALDACYEQLAPNARTPEELRTLGYLHVRERRFADAETTFARARHHADAGADATARHALDLARTALVRGYTDDAVSLLRAGLADPRAGAATRVALHDVLEHALVAAGRRDEALAVLDHRAASADVIELHHRLVREYLARNSVAAAGAALERAAHLVQMSSVLDDRVPAVFAPIIDELRAAGRHQDADVLAARASLILSAN